MDKFKQLHNDIALILEGNCCGGSTSDEELLSILEEYDELEDIDELEEIQEEET